MKTKLLVIALLLFSIGKAQVINGLIQDFRFNGTYASQSGTSTFTASTTSTFVADRFGNANKALRLNNDGITASIASLPTVGGARTVSVWALVNSGTDAYIWNYGNGVFKEGYGLSIQPTSMRNIGVGDDILLNGYTVGAVNWVHVVTTYDGTTARIFHNGVERTSANKNWTTASSVFRLGKYFDGSNVFDGSVDDLRIYNRAITTAEVVELYNQTSAASITSESYVAEYNFNNTYNNIDGNTPFLNIPGVTSFTFDRNSTPNSALQVNASTSKTFATILAPTGKNSRTVSIWYKSGQNAGSPGVFSYGANSQYQTFGMYLASDGSPTFQGFAYDNPFGGGSVTAGVWHHVAMAFDGTLVYVYIDGVSKGSVSRTSLNTPYGTNFFLGNAVNMVYDDLKVYPRALNQTEILALYNAPTLSTENSTTRNSEFLIYPNPAKDFVTISTKNDIRSVEIYNMTGQKVMTTNQKKIDVSSIVEGVYIVKVQDLKGEVSSKKLIIKK